ncbi:MAG: PorP/SprF family type IX secretion system membrane protein [Candidatus Pseudobacter hemicellulosilyticus]|uniref:PorP/SprF family type IX secretion system membrane protein n=1 Tax=Candidatus Pseudobacter hemicellulosilyticus TaxID=3121375 RepID=A0AAJ6BG71_9BACT|nr:MAG: PorP/SprF family type IX secretion system membrane protein [Pseudobacter sp.]
MHRESVNRQWGRLKKSGLLLLMILWTGWQQVALAQDPLFTQFQYSPVYLNPAFTGTGKNEFRATVNSRVQWVNLQAPLQSYNANADYYFSGPKMSLGLMANRFDEGYLKTSQAYLLFAKDFGSDEVNCRDWYVNVAFQGGLGTRNANRNKLLFPDQIDVNGPIGMPSQFELFQSGNKTYLDMSVGMVFCYKNIMGGAAWQHVNEPVNGLLGSGDDSRLPRRYTFHLSYINSPPDMDVADDRILVKPTIIYQQQGVSNSLVVGSLFEFPGWVIGGGLWYRNNFGSGQNWGFTENHTINIGITLKLGTVKNHYNGDAAARFNTGFSYEAELSRPGIRHTKGSMEGGLLYERNFNGKAECRSVDCPVRYPWVFF